MEAAGSTIDPILQKVLDAVPFQLSLDDGVEVVAAAAAGSAAAPVSSRNCACRTAAIDGPAGPINIRIYWPPTDHGTPPVLLFFHGGGFVVGDLDTHDGTCRQHAVGASAVVVSVEYRLAPEHPYPAAVDDAWAATQWVAEHGSEIGADADRLAVAGDSAGGNISAVIAQRARDVDSRRAANPVPAAVVSRHACGIRRCRRSPRTPTRRPRTAQPSPRSPVGTQAKSTCPIPRPGWRRGGPRTWPGCPPAYIAVAGHDPLRDDGIRYGELLAAAGVPVEVDNAETLVHGYVGYAGVVPAATAAMDRGLAALRAALH